MSEPRRTRVLVLDPGHRVGWARADCDDRGHLLHLSEGVAPWKNMALRLHEKAGGYDYIVYETWRLRPDMAKKMVGNDFQSSQFIGAMRLCAWLNPDVTLHSVEPNTKSTGLKLADPLILEHRENCSEEHSKDALDLLSYWLYKRYDRKDPRYA